LQGTWDFAQLTPLERPSEFAGKEAVSEEEVEEFAQRRVETSNKDRRDGGAAADVERAYNDFEDVPIPFKIAGKVPVPVGTYNWTNGDLYIRTSDGRPWSARFEALCCHFYNGNQLKLDFQLDWRPIPLIEFQPRYTYTFIKLPTGSVGIHLITTDFIINFTPDMQLYTQVQFDNISQNFALSLRYRWEYSPGDELFVLFGQASEIPGMTWMPQITQAAVRLGHTFRF
jgi:hypothetical protein